MRASIIVIGTWLSVVAATSAERPEKIQTS
jgi:hypothetical protein